MVIQITFLENDCDPVYISIQADPVYCYVGFAHSVGASPAKRAIAGAELP